MQDANPVCAFSGGRAQSSVLGVRPSALIRIRYQVSGPGYPVPGTRYQIPVFEKHAHGVRKIQNANPVCGFPSDQARSSALGVRSSASDRLRCRVPGPRCQIADTRYLVLETWYLSSKNPHTGLAPLHHPHISIILTEYYPPCPTALLPYCRIALPYCPTAKSPRLLPRFGIHRSCGRLAEKSRQRAFLGRSSSGFSPYHGSWSSAGMVPIYGVLKPHGAWRETSTRPLQMGNRRDSANKDMGGSNGRWPDCIVASLYPFVTPSLLPDKTRWRNS